MPSRLAWISTSGCGLDDRGRIAGEHGFAVRRSASPGSRRGRSSHWCSSDQKDQVPQGSSGAGPCYDVGGATPVRVVPRCDIPSTKGFRVLPELPRQPTVLHRVRKGVPCRLQACQSQCRQSPAATRPAAPFRSYPSCRLACRAGRCASTVTLAGDLSRSCSLHRYRLLRDGHGRPAGDGRWPRLHQWRHPMRAYPTLPALLESFFRNRLTKQRNASRSTVASYRDALRMLILFATQHTGRKPCALTIEDLDRDLILEFLDELENGRSNTIRTRNARLTAIRSFFHHVAANDPASLGIAQRVLAIPIKKPHTEVTHYLPRRELNALIDAPDQRMLRGR